MNNYFKTFIYIIIFCFMFIGVNAQENNSDVYGCTDINSINYNENATIDDDSCIYEEQNNNSILLNNFFNFESLSGVLLFIGIILISFITSYFVSNVIGGFSLTLYGLIIIFSNTNFILIGLILCIVGLMMIMSEKETLKE